MNRSPTLLPFLGGKTTRPADAGPLDTVSESGLNALMERLAEDATEGNVRHVAHGVTFSTHRGSRHVQVVQRTREGEIVRISVLTHGQLRKILAAAQQAIEHATAEPTEKRA